ncbi:MAG: hypothetical protein IJ157_04800 [Clostridia bacterium]|nr:hypothetical protein [Clostridia bacterium]
MAVINKNGLYWEDEQSRNINTNVANQALKNLQQSQTVKQPTMATIAAGLPKAAVQPNAGINTSYGYTPSQSVLDAYNYLQSMINNRPGDYESQYGDQLQSMLDQILNREEFHYDALSDPIYQIYRDQYIQGGRRAMEDTMGAAAALTGGYGNSYAQSVGQQAYNQYMEGLNNMIPTLQEQAYQRYADEGDRLAQNYQLLNQAENQEYGRYRDTYEDWQTERQLAENSFNNERSYDYGAFSDKRTYDQQNEQFAQQMALQQAQLALQQAQFEWQKQQAAASSKKSSSCGSGKSSGGGAAETEQKPKQTQTAQEIFDNASKFAANLYTQSEWQRHSDSNSKNTNQKNGASGTTSYKNYLDQKITDAYVSGKLSTAEVYALNELYGLYK